MKKLRPGEIHALLLLACAAAVALLAYVGPLLMAAIYRWNTPWR